MIDYSAEIGGIKRVVEISTVWGLSSGHGRRSIARDCQLGHAECMIGGRGVGRPSGSRVRWRRSPFLSRSRLGGQFGTDDGQELAAEVDCDREQSERPERCLSISCRGRRFASVTPAPTGLVAAQLAAARQLWCWTTQLCSSTDHGRPVPVVTSCTTSSHSGAPQKKQLVFLSPTSRCSPDRSAAAGAGSDTCVCVFLPRTAAGACRRVPRA